MTSEDILRDQEAKLTRIEESLGRLSIMLQDMKEVLQGYEQLSIEHSMFSNLDRELTKLIHGEFNEKK
jgi:hypothetical protein